MAGQAARLAKADLATDMVREFTELQGTMGGVYARAEGLPEEVWKAIYYHYLPVGVEVDAPPSKAQLGKASITWAAVSARRTNSTRSLGCSPQVKSQRVHARSLRLTTRQPKVWSRRWPMRLIPAKARSGCRLLIHEAYKAFPQFHGASGDSLARSATRRVLLSDREAHLFAARGSPKTVRSRLSVSIGTCPNLHYAASRQIAKYRDSSDFRARSGSCSSASKNITKRI